jgi:predicted RNA-binding Zn-ribbon protein involved in translation (DUF1610 family)
MSAMVELDKSDMDQFAAFHSEDSAVVDENVTAGRRRQDKVLVALFVAFLVAMVGILVLLAIPVFGFVLDFLGIKLPFLTSLQVWWFEDWQGLLYALGLGLVALVTAVIGRRRILHNASLYVEAGCPQCQEHELFRVNRHRQDRLLASFGFPVRRYVCRNCTWQGTRLAGLDPAVVARMREIVVEEQLAS